MNTPLSSFTALVKFQFDRAGLTTEITSVRRQLQGLTGYQERSAKQREQSAARSFVSEMRRGRTHAEALRENAEFDRTAALKAQRSQERADRLEQARLDAWHRKREKEDQKATRDAQARRLKQLRNQDAASRAQASRENTERRARQSADAAEQARYQQWFQQRERQERNAQNAADRRRRAEQQAQNRATREATQRTNEEIRQSARRDAERERQRRARQNRPSNAQGGSSGTQGAPNPWHIGTMAGGLGGLITRGNLAAVGAGSALQQMYTTSNFTAAREPRYEFLTGSKEGGAKQIKYINDLVDELHLDLTSTDEAYTQFLGAVNSSIGADKAQKTFKSIQSFGVMMGANPDNLKRGTKAIQQMLSKQKLSAEELTGFSLAGLA